MNNDQQLLHSVKELWNAEETPSWLKHFAKSVITSYQQKRDDLMTLKCAANSDEFYVQLMNHHFQLGERWKKCWEEYEVDLKSVHNQVQICLDYYNQISEDYRDYDMTNVSEDAEMMLEEIDEKYEKLSTKLESSSARQFVEHSIKLGQIMENPVLAEKLEEMSVKDKAIFQQLIRCTQLLRLIIILEEADIKLLHSSSGEKENQAAILAEARQLATTNKPNTGNDLNTANSEPSIYGAIMENIILLIFNEVRVNKTGLEQVKSKVEQMFNMQLGSNDLVLVEAEFKKQCLTKCIDDITSTISTLFKGINEQVVVSNFNLLESITSIHHIQLEAANYAKTELKTKLTPTEEKKVVEHYKDEFIDHTITYYESLKDEITFLLCLVSFLSNVGNLSSIFKKLNINLNEMTMPPIKNVLGCITNLENKENCSKLSALQDVSKKLQSQECLVLESHIIQTFSDFMTPFNIQQKQVDGRSVVEVVGKHILLSNILSHVEQEFKASSIEEVRIICGYAFHIDADLEKNVWHGKNIAVLTKLVKVYGSVVWDVSGEDSNHKYQEKASTEIVTGVGLPGDDGFPGESGGNVLIMVEQIDNINGWTIKSNGGNGSDGQDGGNGSDGKDGRGITQYTMENNYKSPSLFAPWSPSERPKRRDNIVKSLKEFATLKEDLWRNGCCYIEARSEEGHEIIFCNTDARFGTAFQSYMLYKGSPGAPGKAGGAGGEGGQGGYAGDIAVRIGQNHAAREIRKVANRGADGIPGTGGCFGYHGKMGWDLGYLDYQYWKRTYYYGENENSKLRLQHQHNSIPDSVWCWKNAAYATFTTQNINHKLIKTEKRTEERRKRQHYAIAMMKKSFVETNITSRYEQHFSTAERDALVNMFSQMEQMRQRALEASQQRKKQEETVSEQMKVQHLISSPENTNKVCGPTLTIPDVLDKKAVSYEFILSNLKPSKTNLKIWMGVKTIPLTYEELSNAYSSFGVLKQNNNNLSTDDLQTIERTFINKFKLAAIENAAFDFKVSSPDFVPDTSPMYTTSCLVDNLEGHVMSSFSIETLGTLEDCLENYSYKQQRTNLGNYCQQDCTGMFEACLDIFYQELVNYVDDFPSVEQCYEEYSHFKALQQNELDHFFNTCLQDKLLPKYQAAIDMWRNYENHDQSVKTCIERKIICDPVLNGLHKRYLRIKNKQFNFSSAITGVDILEVYLDLVSKKGPTLRSYRELLARAFDINIRMYIRNEDAQLSLEGNHNPDGNEIINLQSTNGYFSQVYIDIDHLKLQESRRKIISKYLQITDHIESIDQVEILDKIIKKETKLPPQQIIITTCNVTKCIDDTIEQILFFFSRREQPIVKRWLELICTFGKGYYQVLHSFMFRFANEGKHISTDELHFLVNRIVSASKDSANMANLYRWIVMSHQQMNWTREFILLQFENHFKRLLPELSSWREYLTCLENKGILLLLSAKLDQCRPGNFVSTERMEETLHMLSLVKVRTDDLLKLELSEWFYTLEEIYCKQRLEVMVNWEENINEQINNDKLHETSYYAVALINQYSFELTREFFNILEQMIARDDTIKKTDLVDIFCKIYNGKWSLSKNELLSLAGCESVIEWKKSMESKFEGDSNRDISTLARLINGSQNASGTIWEILPLIETCIKNMQSKASKSQFSASNEKENAISKVAGQLAKIDDVVFEYNGYRLRDTQKLAVLTLLANANNNTLVQVATGEGKSLIVVAVAIIKALRGEKVDIITSSSVLAKRDAVINQKIYNHFNINVSHNCNEDIDKRKEAYSKNQVIYGDLSSFQRDYLLHNFYQQNVLGDRNLENVIVDEVDSMLLDRGNNMLYLSHDLPDMDKFEAVYLFIWNWINKSMDFDSDTIKHAVMWNIYGAIKLTDLSKVIMADDATRVAIWEILIEAGVINKKGYLITESVDRSILEQSLGPKLSVYVDRLAYFLNNCINREVCFSVPNYLRPFLELHLDSWIEAAKKAFCMEEGQDYVVDVDRSGSSTDRNPNIIILDRDTGTDMVNSQWEAGLHQFIQLKHSCKTSLQSLKAVFVSNVTFFTFYKQLYGLTGTLGSHRERDLLGEIYRVDFANIPTAKCKRFYEDLPVICSNSNDWKEAIYQSVQYITEKRKRSILIICESVNDVQYLYDSLRERCSCTIRTYTRDFELLDEGELPQQEVIIATNLAGRGTDIKIAPGLRSAGGLHICLTYLPSNVRIEQQAFGRAARSGDRGSGQLIIVTSKVTDTSSSRILHLKRERDSHELRRISNIKEYYETQIKPEEEWFRMFSKAYKKLQDYLNECNHTKEDENLRQVLLESCLDNWAYCLDEHCQNTTSNDIENKLCSFLAQMESLRCDAVSDMRAWTVKSPTQMMKLGRCLIQQHRQESIDLFAEIISKEPQFCEAAHYYKACALSQNIDWDAAVKSHDLESFENELLMAASLLNERKLILTASIAVVDNSKIKDNRNITQINSFKEQKETVCKFYDVLLNSIYDIVGHPVSPEAFINKTINEILSQEIFDALRRDGLLSKPTIKRNVSERELKKLSYSFGLPPTILLEFLQDYRNEKGDSVDMSDFLRSLKQTLKLPSKEAFWKTLRDQQVLVEEIKYIIINKEKYEYLATKWKELPNSGFLESGIECGENELLLYPLSDQQENKWIFEKSLLKAAIGETVYARYKERGVFLSQRKAQLPNKNKQHVFKEFDCIMLKDFEQINICTDDATCILNLLEESNVLQKIDNADNVVYKLKNKVSDIQNIQLEAYKIYEKTVQELLYFCFSYRAAMETVLHQSSKDFDIPLMMKPHGVLVAELITNEIIQPIKVAINITETENKERLSNRLESIGISDDTIEPKVVTNCLEKLDLSDFPQSNYVGIFVDNVAQNVIDEMNISNDPNDDKTKCIASVLEKMSGTRGPLKPTNGITPDIDTADWYVFALNGLDRIIKLHRPPSWWEVVTSFLGGLAKIAVGYCLRLFTVSKKYRDKSDELINDGNMKILDALAMAGELILSHYSKLKNNFALARLILLNCDYLVQLESKILKFAQRVIGNCQSRNMSRYTRRITQSVAHKANIVQEINTFEPLVRNHLETLCIRIEDRIFKYIEQHEEFRLLGNLLGKHKNNYTEKLNKTAGKILKKQAYQEDFQKIIQKMVSSTLQLIEDGIMIFKTNKTISNNVFHNLIGSDETVFEKHKHLLERYVQQILSDFKGNFEVPANTNQSMGHQRDSQNLPSLIINVIRDNLSELLNEHLRKPLMKQASVPLIRYLEHQNHLKLGFDVHAEPADDFEKHLRTQELRREMDGKSHAPASAVESLLDFQFTDELKKREKCAPEMARLAMRIRLGKPIEVAHLETCLDAVRFILLSRGIVISNISVKAVENGVVEGKYSSPRNTYRLAAKLNLNSGHFRIGQSDSDTPNSEQDCLYDILKRYIFELGKIPLKNFVNELSNYFVEFNEMKSLSYSAKRLGFRQNWYYGKVCFAQFIEGCIENPEQTIAIYNILLQRANTNDWHGWHLTDVVVDDNRILKPGTLKYLPFDELNKNAIVAIETAFYKLFPLV